MVLGLKDILAARRTIRNLVKRTPLEHSFLLSQWAGCEIYLKLENQQVTGSFKPRGAVNRIASLSVEEKARGLVTASRRRGAQRRDRRSRQGHQP